MEIIRSIAQLGEPVLRELAVSIQQAEMQHQKALAVVMLATLDQAGGVGLAAPQIFESKCLIVVASKPTKRYPYAPEMTPTVMINPQFTPNNDVLEKDWEGCLSIPGIRALVPRFRSIHIAFTNLAGEAVEADYEGFPARVFQHEFDHLRGLVYLDRVESNRDIVTEQTFLKLVAA